MDVLNWFELVRVGLSWFELVRVGLSWFELLPSDPSVIMLPDCSAAEAIPEHWFQTTPRK